jgi:hypothetical protein
MKIEIGESLIFSWLRHVRGCPIAQANWKPSATWPIRREPALVIDFEKMRETAGQRLGFEVFKRSSFQQFMRQAEIDVLGLRFGEVGLAAIAVDSAFHENGVQYGDLKETVGRILKKMIRTAFVLDGYFDLHQADIVFATPKMHNAVQEALLGCWPELQSILADCGSLSAGRVHMHVVTNGDFVEEIIQPVLDRMDQVADTGELFLRAQQLVRFSEVTPRQRRAHQSSAAAQPVSDEEPKIGEHVRQTMVRLAQAGRLRPEAIGKLLDARYCKMTFNLGLPFLKPIKPHLDLANQRMDERGYGRYWKDPLDIGGSRFLMCSQWFVWQRAAFDRWVQDLG